MIVIAKRTRFRDTFSMNSRRPFFRRLTGVGLSLAVTLSLSFGQELTREKLTTGHVPIEVLRPALEKVLSPEGRFVILPGQGQILVIDRAENIKAAAVTIATLEVPVPQVALDFAFKTNVAPGMVGPQPVDSFGSFPFPTRWQGPRIIQQGNNVFTIIPAHPTNFKRRAVGDILETNSTVNPDGSVSVDINAEHTEFEGFINYGSGIFASGTPGMVPVVNGVRNPEFFGPFLTQSKILVPIFSTTRITTQILVKPEVVRNQVHLDMVPQIEIETSEPGAENLRVPFPQFRTSLDVNNGQVGKINGFDGASVEFNREFLGAKDEEEGGTAILIRPSIRPGDAAPAEETEEQEKPEAAAPSREVSR